MKAKVIDHPNQQQNRPPRLEDTPQYREALVNATNDILGETIGNLGDAKAKAKVYENHVALLQAQIKHLQDALESSEGRAKKADTPSAKPPETTKLQRRLEAETRERQALEGQLKELRQEIETQRRIDEKSEERIQAMQAEVDDLQARTNTAVNDKAQALALVADIRKAAGDPEGKLMQEELVKHIAALVANQKKPRKKAAPKSKATPKKKEAK